MEIEDLQEGDDGDQADSMVMEMQGKDQDDYIVINLGLSSWSSYWLMEIIYRIKAMLLHDLLFVMFTMYEMQSMMMQCMMIYMYEMPCMEWCMTYI